MLNTSKMVKSAVHTEDAPKPAGPYSQGVKANGFFYTAGLGPQDPTDGGSVPEGVQAQTWQALTNVKAVLATGDLTLDNCVKTTVHLADLADFPAFNPVYEQFFTAPFPVRTTVGSKLSGILIEIDVVAAIPQDQ